MAFISAMGKDAYNCKIIELLNKLLNPPIVNDQPTHSISNAVMLQVLWMVMVNS